MHKQDIIFTVTFVITLMVLIYFLSGSVTGYFIQSMHCEAGVCKEFCKSNSDCGANEICCDKGNFGVCETTCEKEYIIQPQLDVDPGELPMPSPGKQAIVLYSALITIAILLGYAYFSKRKKSKQQL